MIRDGSRQARMWSRFEIFLDQIHSILSHSPRIKELVSLILSDYSYLPRSLISSSAGSIIMNYDPVPNQFSLDSSASFPAGCNECKQISLSKKIQNLRLNPTPCWITFKSSGFPSSGAKAQHLFLISSAKSKLISPLQSLSTRHPPSMTPLPGLRGKM